MADQPKRRWRTRFSVRTFLILVTLACGYAACWWPTKTPGVHDIWSHRFHEEYKTWRQTYGFQPGVNAEAAFPLVISTIEMNLTRLLPHVSVTIADTTSGFSATLSVCHSSGRSTSSESFYSHVNTRVRISVFRISAFRVAEGSPVINCPVIPNVVA